MKKTLLTILLLSFVIHGQSQIKDKEYYLDISKALGYAYSIELSINKIIEYYPDLSKKALLAKLDFNSVYKNSVSQMESELAEKMNVSKNKLKEELMVLNKLASFTHSDAKDYLDTFEKERIKGKNELYSEFVSILLRHSPAYNSNPTKEFTDNFKARFDSDNHSKAKGLNFSIDYPKSWIRQEGKRPNVLTLIQSYDNSCKITLLVQDLIEKMGLETKDLTQEDFDYIDSKEFENEMANQLLNNEVGEQTINSIGFENISGYTFNKTKIDGQPAMVIKAFGEIKRSILEMKVHLINYVILYKNYVIYISSVIGNSDGILSEEVDKYGILSELIANSTPLDKMKKKRKIGRSLSRPKPKTCRHLRF
jgi:hypothetical protein